MDRFKARPLQTLSLTSRPLSPHALAWSCDAELAVATADCISIFLPEYPPPPGVLDADSSNSGSLDPPTTTNNNLSINPRNHASSNHQDTSQPQFTLSLQASAIIQPNRAINAHLCASAHIDLPPHEPRPFKGVGPSIIAGSGSALGQVVRVEWSPGGLGCNLRPILAGLATNGSVVAFGEHVDQRAAGSSSGMRARSFKSWKMLWGLGANLPVPDQDCEGGYWDMNDRITAFSWAKEVAVGRALCAYANDAGEIGVMSVQYGARRGSEDDDVWDLKELGRFDGGGPHGTADSADPDFVPGGSIFSLRWSPWLVRSGYRTATLAYMASHYVGFRRVIIYGEWERGEVPNVIVEEADSTGICLFLSSDAYMEWEDAIWPEGTDAFVSRGIIATPFVAKPFQVVLNSALDRSMEKHSPHQCSSAYPPDSEASTNPITGLVIHPPDARRKPEVPYYTLVRLSATPTNVDWYQTNLPEDLGPLPQWAADLGDQTARLVSRGAALESIDSDLDSDSDDLDPDPAPDDSYYSYPHAVARPPAPQVHPYRFRLWGLALSPGGTCSALLASRHSTQHPNRRGFCSVHFDWQVPDSGGGDEATHRPARNPITSPLTTEGRMWEWMYGMGEDVPGATSARRRLGATATLPPPPSPPPGARSSILRAQFRHVAIQLPCVFCGSKMHLAPDKAVCQNGHSFATCAASGVPIMAPGISRVCGVCSLRCLKASELERLAGQYALSAEGVTAAAFGQVCGSCGGKFVV